MMKLCGYLLLLLTVQAILIIQPTKGQQKKCSTDADCPKNFCCPWSYQRTERAKLLNSFVPRSLMDAAPNVCKPLAVVNEACYTGGVATCPRCRSGLFCRGTGLQERPQGEIGICMRVISASQRL